MKRFLIAAALLAGFSSAAEGQMPTEAERQQLYRDTETCMRLRAAELEPSGESASDIAIAAMQTCENMFVDYVVAKIILDEETSRTDEDRRQQHDATELALRNVAVARVVEIRADRNKAAPR